MLLERYPNAFLLLTQIGLRAWWKKDEKSPVGLEYGQAFIGDYKSIGLTEKGYRVAKRRLAKNGLASFTGVNKGTVANLLDTSVYSITKGDEIAQNRGRLGAGKGQAEGGQRGRLGADKETTGTPVNTNDRQHPSQLEGEPRADNGADNGAGQGQAEGEEGATNSHTQAQSHPHKKNTPKPPRGEMVLSLDDLPHSNQFREAWHEWQEFRKQKRQKLTPASIKKQLTQLSKLNEHDAIASINQSITNGWTGLFDPKSNGVNHRSVGTLNHGRSYPCPAGGNKSKHVEGIS